MLTDYAEVHENLRIVDAGTIKYKIILDRGISLWHIETDKGPIPVALRGKYTRCQNALHDIQVYISKFPERQVTYKKLAGKNKEE